MILPKFQRHGLIVLILNMLSEKEKSFMEYWEKERERQAGFGYRLIAGLPKALLFYLPVPVFVLLVYFFLPEWYYKISKRAGSLMPTISIALLAASVFFALFRMHFKWEANEIYYEELRQKQKKEARERE